MYKVDLHTHSEASPDGGITAAQYRAALFGGIIDYVAITDHNRIDFALDLRQEIGNQIIVGEEIMSSQGEIIGLFLSRPVAAGLSPQATIEAIRAQNGLVYIPHPFETVRKGLHPAVLEELAGDIDILEVYNGRAFAQDRSSQAVVWAKFNRVAGAAGSDAHGRRGLGKTYTSIADIPYRENLVNQIKGGLLMAGRPGVRALMYPKFNRLRKKIAGSSS